MANEVTINAQTYSIYGELAEAKVYMAARLGAAAWNGANDTTRSQALVTATRWLRRLPWASVPTYADAPEAVEHATYELALLLIANPALQEQSSSGSNKKRLKAGSAEIEFFRPTDGPAIPLVAWQLIRDSFDPGSASGEHGEAYGTCAEPEIGDGFGDIGGDL